MSDTATDKKADDVTTNTATNSDNGADTQTTSDTDKTNIPLSVFMSEKKKRQELEERLRSLEEERKAQEDAKLQEEGKLKELLDKRTSENNSLQSELEKAKAEAEESKNFKAAQVAKYKSEMGSKWIDEYENLSLTALDSLVNLTRKEKISTDNGTDGRHDDIELTAEQKRDAEAKYPFTKKEKAWEYHKQNLIKQNKIKVT